MEHSLSDDAAAALCKILDVPEECPDDKKIIPPCPLDVTNCDECEEVREDSPNLLTELSNLKPGEKGHVAFIRGGKKACQRLLDMGLTKGAKIRVLNAAPFKGPIEVSVRGSSLAIGRGLASHVFVEINNTQRLNEQTPLRIHHQ
jgi:DtxR family Mn-dependent transcriptional regulator